MAGNRLKLLWARPPFTGGLAPVNDVAPVVSGSTAVDQSLSTSNGLWLNGPTSYFYVWQESANGTTGWADISGETSATLMIDAGLLTKYVRAGVRAVNSIGSSAFTYSAARGPVTSDVVTPLIWPGDDWAGTANQGWTAAGVATPIPTAYDMVTPRPSGRITTAAFQRHNENLVLVVDADAPGGVAYVEFNYENRVVSVSEPGWYDRPQWTGGTKGEYGYIVELDITNSLALLPVIQTYGEARLFITIYPNNPAIQPAVIGVDIQNTTDALKGMPFYPCRTDPVEHWVNVAKTPGFVSPTYGAADVTGSEAIRDGLALCKANPNQCWGLRIIEQLPSPGGRMDGWKIGNVANPAWTFQKWFVPIMAAEDVVAIMGDDTLIYTQPNIDMLEFRGNPLAADPRNVKIDWVRISYQMQNNLLLPGRCGILFRGVEMYYGTPLNPNPNDPSGTPGTGSGESCLYGGRQCGNYIFSTLANPAYSTYRCFEDVDVHDMAAFGIPYARVANNVTVDTVSGSCAENCIGSIHNLSIRNIGGFDAGFRTQRNAARIDNDASTANFRWLEKPTINSTGSAPGSITLNTGTGYEPQVGTRTYNAVTMTPDGTMQGTGAYGGFGAKAQIVVTNGQIVSVNFTPPNGDAGVKYRIGEKLKPAMMPTSGSVKNSFFYVDEFGVNRSGYGTSTPSQFDFTLGGNFNIYEWPTNDPVAAKAAGPVKSILLQERSFSIETLADAINDPVTGWGPEYSMYLDPSWSDVYRYDSTMLSLSTLGQVDAIPMTSFTSSLQLTGIMDIHSDNEVWTQNAFNIAHRFIDADDFTLTAWFSSGRGGRWNGVSVRNFISRSVDSGNPQSGYFQCQTISSNLAFITGFNNGGVGNNTFLGTGYTATASGTVVYDRWMVDDMFWAITRDPDPVFSNFVMRKASTSRLQDLVGPSTGNSKGLNSAFTPAQIWEDPTNADIFTALRPIEGGPGMTVDGTPTGALQPTGLITAGNRGWVLS